MDLRITFNHEALLYDKARPHYPNELFDRLVEVTHIKPGDHLLEIGPGTGQATLPLAAKGCHITGIELGEHLAAVARHNLRRYENVEVITDAFEDVDLPKHSFQLVYSATAFHWVKPEVQFTKTHELLASSGYLAIIHTNHVSSEHGDQFQHESQHIYDRYWPAQAVAHKAPAIDELTPPDFDAKLFKLARFECFPFTARYSAAQYSELVGTYSPTLALPEEKRRAFLNDIRQFVNEKHGGRLDKLYIMSLAIVQAISG